MKTANWLLIGVMAFSLCNTQQATAAGSPPVEWEKTFGESYYDNGFSVQQTPDGGYIIAGSITLGGNNFDVYLIKTDPAGNKLWDQTYGGSGRDDGYSVDQTTDGGYIVVGRTTSYGAGDRDVYLIKTDSVGNQEWYKTFGGGGRDEGYTVQQTSDGGYIITGLTFSFGSGHTDVYLIKTDSDGNEQWYQTFGGSGGDYAESVQQTPDGGYIIAGSTGTFGAGDNDVYLIKTDSAGNELWHKTFGGIACDICYSIDQTTDGGYILSGRTQSFGAGGVDVYLIKTDSSGNPQWEKTFGGSGTDWGGHSVQQTTDGGYITTGRTDSFGAGGYDVYLIKTDSAGNKQWQETFGGTAWEYGFSVQQTTDGGYIITGQTESYGEGDYDVYLVKLAHEPAECCPGTDGTLGDGLVAYYPFEGNADDESGNGNHGTEHSWPSYVGGVCGEGISFDGVDDYADCGDVGAFPNGISVAVWIYPTVNNAGGEHGGKYLVLKAIAYGLYNDDWCLMRIAGTNRIRFFIGHNAAIVESTIELNINQWNHVVATYDKQSMKLYINGVKDSAEKFTNIPIHYCSASLKIGGLPPYYSDFFKGLIDEARIYDRALSDCEIRKLACVPEPTIEAAVDIDPDTLNLNSKGKWITCYISLPEGYDVASIDSETVMLEDAVGADWMWCDEEVQVAMAKFSRLAVEELLVELGLLGDIELIVTGKLADGTRFEGRDTIRIIDKGGKK